MNDVILSFGKGLDGYLTKEQIKSTTPLVFANTPTNPDVSSKYLFVNTETIIDDLDKLGWLPVQAAQRKSKKVEGTIYSKHMVAFQNPNIKITSQDGDDAYPRIMNDMKNRILTEDEKRKMAIDAMLIRAGVKELQYDEETITDILDPKRDADKGDDLWRVFNVIQEKITQGNFHAALTGAKVRKVRKIKSFEKEMKVNKELFKLATALV